MKRNLDNKLINHDFFESKDFKEFLNSFRRLTQNYLNDCPLDKLFEENKIPFQTETLMTNNKNLHFLMNAKKLQTKEKIDFSKDLMNLKNTLSHDVKRDSLHAIPNSIPSDKLKILENEMESLRSEIRLLKEANDKQPKKSGFLEVPKEFNKNMKWLSKFNEIIEDRISSKDTNKIIKELGKEIGSLDFSEKISSVMEDEKDRKGAISEVSILNGIELLLSQNKIDEALKLVRWRRKVLKIIDICGYEVGSEISKTTLKKMDIDIEDVIFANLEAAIDDEDNWLSCFIEKGKENNEI